MKCLQQTQFNSSQANGYLPSGCAEVYLCLAFLLCITFSYPAHSDGKIVKWKDEKGVTHYGNSIPAQYVSRENSEINRQGVTLKRNKAMNAEEMAQAQAVNSAKQEQERKDSALLNAFTHANEIDLARDRNLQMDAVAIEGLQIQKSNAQKRLAENQNYANGFIKKNKTVPADISLEIKANQADIANQDQQIAQRKATMEVTRKRFDDDKARFIMLKNGTN